MTPSAHVGHWLADLLYVAPLALLAVVLLVGRMRAALVRRRERRGTGAVQ
jgi:hypothetical protein